MDDAQFICNGCTECALRCIEGIKFSEIEYWRIVEELRSLDPKLAHRVLRQPKVQPWFEEITYTACLFLDVKTKLCLIYPARPLVCKLFGRVQHLPCPIGKVPQDLYADHLLSLYTNQPLRTFQQWMAINGLFNFDDLLGAPEEFKRYEL